MVEKSPNAFRTISEVSDALEVPAHVLRFWESKFSQIKPVKRGGGRRYYRPTDLDLIRGIRDLLYSDGLTIKGVQKVLREKGVRHVMALGSVEDVEGQTADAEPLWDEPDGHQLEQNRQERLFEMAEAQAPAPSKQEPEELPDAPPVSSAETARELEALKSPEPEPDIRSLFDDPPAEVEPCETSEAVAPAEPEAQAEAPADTKKDEIKRVLGRLEQLRDKMKSH